MLYDPNAPPEEIWQTGRVEFALRYPFSNGWTTVAGCALLVFLSALVLPAVVLVGYAYAACRGASYGELRISTPSGLLAAVWKGAGAVLLTAVVVTAVSVAGGAAAGFARAEIPEYAEEAEVVGAVAAFVAAAYLLPAFGTVYAVTGSLLRTLLSARAARFALSTHYAVAWLLSLVFGVALLIVGVISVPTVVGVFLWLGYAPLAVASYWGRVYKEALDKGVVSPEDTAA